MEAKNYEPPSELCLPGNNQQAAETKLLHDGSRYFNIRYLPNTRITVANKETLDTLNLGLSSHMALVICWGSIRVLIGGILLFWVNSPLTW